MPWPRRPAAASLCPSCSTSTLTASSRCPNLARQPRLTCSRYVMQHRRHCVINTHNRERLTLCGECVSLSDCLVCLCGCVCVCLWLCVCMPVAMAVSVMCISVALCLCLWLLLYHCVYICVAVYVCGCVSVCTVSLYVYTFPHKSLPRVRVRVLRVYVCDTGSLVHRICLCAYLVLLSPYFYLPRVIVIYFRHLPLILSFFSLAPCIALLRRTRGTTALCPCLAANLLRRLRSSAISLSVLALLAASC